MNLRNSIFRKSEEMAKLEVKKFWETDSCEFCNAIQGGYIISGINAEGERYINVRDGNKCNNCGIPESPL